MVYTLVLRIKVGRMVKIKFISGSKPTMSDSDYQSNFCRTDQNFEHNFNSEVKSNFVL